MRSSALLAAVCGSIAIGLMGACSAGGSGGFKHGGGGQGTGGMPPVLGSGGNGLGTLPTPPGGDGTPLVPTCEKCTDFPADPIFVDNTPTSTADLFKTPASGAGPCVIEPQDGSLFPANWLRPRVNVTSPNAKAYQITVHADREVNDLVAYTTQLPWYFPKDYWTAVAKNVFEEDLTVTVRASTGSGAPTESVVKFRIAPVNAGGSIVFWHSIFAAAGAETSALFGFAPGDEAVVAALYPDQVKSVELQSSGALTTKVDAISSNISGAISVNDPGTPAGGVACVGCHSATPGGEAVAATAQWPWNVTVSSVQSGSAGKLPDYVTPAGQLMAQSTWQGVTSFSAGDWDGTKHRYVTSFAPRTMSTDPSQAWAFWDGQDGNSHSGKDNLVWIDLSAKGTVSGFDPTKGLNNASQTMADLVKLRGTLWDIIARDGDTRGAVTPNWSHDAQTIAYTSTDSTSDGRVGPTKAGQTGATEIDVYTVPFGGGKGGTAKPVAAEKGVAEYYPSFSPDDRYIAYNRVAKIDNNPMYYRADAELYLIPSGGGDKVRLAANDPPTCTGLSPTTIHNSWPKWSPHPKNGNGATYYFMTFSSSRYTTVAIADTQANKIVASELYITAVKEDADGKLTTYPAIYLWNQNTLMVTDSAGKATATSAPGLNVTPAWEEFVIPAVPPPPPL